MFALNVIKGDVFMKYLYTADVKIYPFHVLCIIEKLTLTGIGITLQSLAIVSISVFQPH